MVPRVNTAAEADPFGIASRSRYGGVRGRLCRVGGFVTGVRAFTACSRRSFRLFKPAEKAVEHTLSQSTRPTLRAAEFRSSSRRFQTLWLQYAQRSLSLALSKRAWRNCKANSKIQSSRFRRRLLRDSYELANRGFRVISFDLNDRRTATLFRVVRLGNKFAAGTRGRLRSTRCLVQNATRARFSS
jgi:hypothetical protein